MSHASPRPKVRVSHDCYGRSDTVFLVTLVTIGSNPIRTGRQKHNQKPAWWVLHLVTMCLFVCICLAGLECSCQGHQRRPLEDTCTFERTVAPSRAPRHTATPAKRKASAIDRVGDGSPNSLCEIGLLHGNSSFHSWHFFVHSLHAFDSACAALLIANTSISITWLYPPVEPLQSDL